MKFDYFLLVFVVLCVLVLWCLVCWGCFHIDRGLFFLIVYFLFQSV
jgi:hypothetical protein